MKTKFVILCSLLIVTLLLSACSNKNTSIKLKDDEMKIYTTLEGVKFVRTPDEYFKDLPNWDYEPKYIELDGLRQAYYDEGPRDGQPILLLHGQPSWSYLYRYMIPSLVNDGYRVIAMDNLGMGRSDKPIDLDYYTFDIHLSRLNRFIDELKLTKLTAFVQDWGSVIGLYSLSTDLERFDRTILANGGIPVVKEAYKMPSDIEKSNKDFYKMMKMIPAKQFSFFDKNGKSKLPINDESAQAEGFGQWMAYALHYENFRASDMLEGLTYNKLTKEEENAYDAPFPARIAMAGVRTFPSLLNDLVGRTEDKLEALKGYKKPFLLIFGANDPGLAKDTTQEWVKENIPGAKNQPHHLFMDASHYVQDDKGEEVSKMVDEFIKNNPIK